jgi:hypothetical protein
MPNRRKSNQSGQAEAPAPRQASLFRSRRGSELVEFALLSTLLLPMLFGTFVVGTNLGRSIQVAQLSRDAGHMYARNVDFSATANQDIIVRLAYGLGITRTAGNGNVIFSTVMHIGDPQCDAAGLTGGACVNRYQDVIIHRVVVGNPSIRASVFGTPATGLVGTDGNVANYLTEPSVRASGFSTLLVLQNGEVAYVAEAYVTAPDFSLPGYESTAVYARSIF